MRQKSVKGGSAEPYQGLNTPSQRCVFHFLAPWFVGLQNGGWTQDHT